MKTIYQLETLKELLDAMAPGDPSLSTPITLPSVIGQLVIERKGVVMLVNDENYQFQMPVKDFFRELCGHVPIHLTQWDNFPEVSV